MQMIDVLKRLAELDAKNPSIAKEQTVSEASPYIGDYMLEPPDDKPEWPQMDPAEIVLNVFDPEALRSDPDANDWPTIPVKVIYTDETTNVKDPECKIAKVINQQTNQEIKLDDLAMGDQDEIFSMCHADLQNRISDQMSNNRYDLDEASSLREGQNKMTNNVNECGMMGGMSQPRSPASINMTADSGSELTGMLRDIMQLAGLKQVGPTDLGHEHEPAVVSAPPTISVATVDDEPNMMRSMIDKLNEPDSSDSDEEAEVKEADNTPDESYVDPQDGPLGVSGPASRDQTGSEKAGKNRHNMNAPVGDPGVTFESLMAEYKKFISEDHTADRNEIMNDLVRDTAAQLGIDLQSPVSYDVAKEIAQQIEAASSDTPYWNQKQHTEDDVLSWMDDAGLIGQDQDDTGYDLDDPKHPDYAEHQSDQADYNRDKRRHGDFDETNTMESMLKLAGFKK